MIHEVTSPFTGRILRWKKETGDQVSEYDPEPIYFVKPDIPGSKEYGIRSPATGRLTILRMGRPGSWVIGRTTVIAYIDDTLVERI